MVWSNHAARKARKFSVTLFKKIALLKPRRHLLFSSAFYMHRRPSLSTNFLSANLLIHISKLVFKKLQFSSQKWPYNLQIQQTWVFSNIIILKRQWNKNKCKGHLATRFYRQFRKWVNSWNYVTNSREQFSASIKFFENKIMS